MAEALSETQVEQPQVVTQQSNPFDDKTWLEQPNLSQENLAANAEPIIENSNEPNYND